MRNTSQLPLILLGLTSTISAFRSSRKADAILLSQVKTLTLRSDAKTSSRRVSPIPQLTCIGGAGKGLYSVDVMRCKNAGSEYNAEDIQWTCQASLPAEFKLGGTEVICEGYDTPEDPFVLKGSCGVEYRLALTDVGEAKYGRNSFERAYRNPNGASVGNALFTLLFWSVFIAVIGTILWKIFAPGAVPDNRYPNGGNQQSGNGGGGGGGGDDSNDDPPPPYYPRNPKPASTSRGTDAPSGQSWKPGFWSGTATGAAAGYAASRLGGRTTAQNLQQQRYNAYNPPQSDTTSWFGRTRDPDPQPPRSSPFGGGSSYFGGGGGGSNEASSSRHESTGFGGTRRR